MKLKLSNDMKTYLECIHQAALDMKATDHYNSYYAIINYIAPILNRAADMYSEQSNSHKPVVVRGGDIKHYPVQCAAGGITNQVINTTLNTPTEPLPAEGSAKSVCDGCEDVAGFYLGTTCPKCYRPFRSVK